MDVLLPLNKDGIKKLRRRCVEKNIVLRGTHTHTHTTSLEPSPRPRECMKDMERHVKMVVTRPLTLHRFLLVLSFHTLIDICIIFVCVLWIL